MPWSREGDKTAPKVDELRATTYEYGFGSSVRLIAANITWSQKSRLHIKI